MAWILSAFADEADQDMDRQIAALQEARIKSVDLRNVDGINIVDLPLDHARRVRKKLDDAGVSVCMYGSPIGKIDLADDFETDCKRLTHLGALKEIFGARAVRLFSYFNKKAGASPQEWKARSIERLTALVELAEKLDLVLYHEHEPGVYGGDLPTVRVLRDELHLLHPSRFKLIFDFDNFNQAGHDVWACYQELKDVVGAIHLKESRRQPDGAFMHVPAGQGDGQIEKILRDLASRGWQGSLTLEPHLARSPAVLATGPHGQANQFLADLSPFDCFVVAAQAAHGLLKGIARYE